MPTAHTKPDNALPHRLKPIFRDRDELASAPELGSVIEDALDRSRNLIVICSPQSAKSQWVNKEVLYFKQLGRADRIFCLIVDGDPEGGDKDCFPEALRQVVSANGDTQASDSAPIAADVRPGADNRTDALLRVVAGMLSVSFDSLKQRELVARNRRLRWVLSGTLLLLAVLSWLINATINARNIAEDQRDRAEEATRTAERARRDAIKNLKQAQAMEQVFMSMFKEAGERQDENLSMRQLAAESVDRVRKLYQDEPETAARVLSQIGLLFDYLGDRESATPIFESILAMPNLDEKLRAQVASDMAVHEFAIGRVDRARELMDVALSLWRSDPDLYQTELVNSSAARARLARANGDPDDAVRIMQEALPLRKNISGLNSIDTAVFLSNMAVAHIYANQYDEAVKRLRESFKIREAIGSATTSGALVALGNLATLERRLGELEQSRKHFKQAVEQFRALYGPSAGLAGELYRYASLLTHLGEFATAAALLDEAIPMAKQFSGEQSLVFSYALQARALLEKGLGKSEKATATAAQACEIMEDLVGADSYKSLYCRIIETASGPDNTNTLMRLAQLLEALETSGKEGRFRLVTAYDIYAEKALYEPGSKISLKALRRAIELHSEISGNEHYATGRNRALLGASLQHLGDASGSKEFEAGMTIMRNALGDDHYLVMKARQLAESIMNSSGIAR